MQASSLLGKGLAFAVIVLFLSVSLLPTTGSFVTEKYPPMVGSVSTVNDLMRIASRGINITLNGTMGDNGWYVSDVIISVTVENINMSSIKYRFNNGSWQTYYTPFRVHEDGYYSFEVMVIDTEGTPWYAGPVYFKIDQTPPFFSVIKERIGFFRWRITVVASDNMSGLSGKVGIYINGVLQYSVILPGPYEWTFIYWGFSKPSVVTVRVYDKAGNFGDVPFTNSLRQNRVNIPSSNQ